MWTDLWLRCEGGNQNKFTSRSMTRLISIMANVAGVLCKKIFCQRLELPLFARPRRHLNPPGLGGRPSQFVCRLHVWSWTGLLLVGLMLLQPELATPQTFSEELTSKAANANETGVDARIQILTRPIGALVFIEGEYSMAGRTPYTITHFLSGVYRIRATKTGYENWSAEYSFNGRGDDKLTIKLKPKTRAKAVMRSAVFPGWGQVYADQRTKGSLISLLQFSAIGVSIYQDSRYAEALDDYRAALNNFQANQNTQDGQTDLIARVRATKANLDDAYARRKRWLIITGSIYLYNLLDAALFFPSYHRGDLDVSVTLEPQPDASGAAIGLNVNAKF
ncbi:MAG: DUF5683 domain-containing protein [bacterium]